MGKLETKKDTRLKLYITLFVISGDAYDDQAKELLKTFINTLNKLGRAKLQYVECTNPSVIEIREMR